MRGMLEPLHQALHNTRLARYAWFVVLLGVTCISIVRHLIVWPIATFDLPAAVISAARVANGDRPFIDMNVLYGPVGHYIVASVIRAFPSLPPMTSSERLFFLVSVINLLLITWGTMWLTQKRPYLRWAAVACLVIWGPMFVRFSYFSGIPFVIWICACMLAWMGLSDEDAGRPRDMAIAGLGLIGVLMLAIKINFGLYLLTIGFGVIVIRVLAKRRAAARALIFYCASSIAGLVFYAGIMWSTGMLGPYLADMRQFVQHASSRQLPLSTLTGTNLLQFVDVSAVLVLLLVVAWQYRHSRIASVIQYYVLLSACSFHYLTHRFDGHHFHMFLVVALYACLVVLAHHQESRFTTAMLTGAVLALMMMAVPESWGAVVSRIGLFFPAFNPQHNNDANTTDVRASSAYPSVRRGGVQIFPEEAVMLDYVEAQMGAADRVLWATVPGSCQSSYDACVNNMLYMAEGRLPSGRFWLFDTPVTPFPEIQEQMIADLTAKPVRVVGMQKNWVANPLGHNIPESDLLYKYVQAHYNLMKSVDVPGRSATYQIFVRAN
jgi:hypothetical protein